MLLPYPIPNCNVHVKSDIFTHNDYNRYVNSSANLTAKSLSCQNGNLFIINLWLPAVYSPYSQVIILPTFLCTESIPGTSQWRHNDHDSVSNRQPHDCLLNRLCRSEKILKLRVTGLCVGIHRDRWIPRTKGQLRGKCFHLMTSSWDGHLWLSNNSHNFIPWKHVYNSLLWISFAFDY